MPYDQIALLDLDSGANGLQLLLDLVGFRLGDAFLDGLGHAFDEVLGFLQPEARDGADFLDDLDLLCAEAREDDVELRLLLSNRRGRAAAETPNLASSSLTSSESSSTVIPSINFITSSFVIAMFLTLPYWIASSFFCL
jgi:hypothetical protein